MKILPETSGMVMRIEFYQPYPPAQGYYTFTCVGNSAEEIIGELCRQKRITMRHITDKTILVDNIDCISTGLAYYCCEKYQDEYNVRKQQQQHKMEKYIEQQKTKPENSSYDNNNEMSFTPL